MREGKGGERDVYEAGVRVLCACARECWEREPVDGDSEVIRGPKVGPRAMCVTKSACVRMLCVSAGQRKGGGGGGGVFGWGGGGGARWGGKVLMG